MKKILSAILVCILMIGCVFAVASCAPTDNGETPSGGIPNGTYTQEDADEVVNIISGNTWTMKGELMEGMVVKIVYTYTREGDTVSLDFDKIELVSGDADAFNSIKANLEQNFSAQEISGTYEKTSVGFNLTIEGYTTVYTKQ